MIGIVMSVPIGTHAEIFVWAEFVNHYAWSFRPSAQNTRYQNLGTGTKFPLTSGEKELAKIHMLEKMERKLGMQAVVR